MIKTITADMVEKSGVLGLVWRVFKEFEAPEYSDEGIREFQAFIAADTVKGHMSSGKLLIWGYWDDSKLVGMIATRPPCHISLLFVDSLAQLIRTTVQSVHRRTATALTSVGVATATPPSVALSGHTCECFGLRSTESP